MTDIPQGEANYRDLLSLQVTRPATRWHGGRDGGPGPAFTFAALSRYLADHGQVPPANSPSTEVGRTREAQLGNGVEIHVHGGQVPANGGHPSEIHVVSVATGQTEKLAVIGPDQAHALPGEEYGHTYVQVGAWLGRPTHDPADVRTAVLRDNGVTGEVSPS